MLGVDSNTVLCLAVKSEQRRLQELQKRQQYSKSGIGSKPPLPVPPLLRTECSPLTLKVRILRGVLALANLTALSVINLGISLVVAHLSRQKVGDRPKPSQGGCDTEPGPEC